MGVVPSRGVLIYIADPEPLESGWSWGCNLTASYNQSIIALLQEKPPFNGCESVVRTQFSFAIIYHSIDFYFDYYAGAHTLGRTYPQWSWINPKGSMKLQSDSSTISYTNKSKIYSLLTTPRSSLTMASKVPWDMSGDWAFLHPGHKSAMVAVTLLLFCVLVTWTLWPHKELENVSEATHRYVCESPHSSYCNSPNNTSVLKLDYVSDIFYISL